MQYVAGRRGESLFSGIGVIVATDILSGEAFMLFFALPRRQRRISRLKRIINKLKIYLQKMLPIQCEADLNPRSKVENCVKNFADTQQMHASRVNQDEQKTGREGLDVKFEITRASFALALFF